MTRSPALAKAFRGRWRIIEMEVWPDDYLDLIEPAHITFEGDTDGVFVFGGVFWVGRGGYDGFELFLRFAVAIGFNVSFGQVKSHHRIVRT